MNFCFSSKTKTVVPTLCAVVPKWCPRWPLILALPGASTLDLTLVSQNLTRIAQDLTQSKRAAPKRAGKSLQWKKDAVTPVCLGTARLRGKERVLRSSIVSWREMEIAHKFENWSHPIKKISFADLKKCNVWNEDSTCLETHASYRPGYSSVSSICSLANTG